MRHQREILDSKLFWGGSETKLSLGRFSFNVSSLEHPSYAFRANRMGYGPFARQSHQENTKGNAASVGSMRITRLLISIDRANLHVIWLYRRYSLLYILATFLEAENVGVECDTVWSILRGGKPKKGKLVLPVKFKSTIRSFGFMLGYWKIGKYLRAEWSKRSPLFEVHTCPWAIASDLFAGRAELRLKCQIFREGMDAFFEGPLPSHYVFLEPVKHPRHIAHIFYNGWSAKYVPFL